MIIVRAPLRTLQAACCSGQDYLTISLENFFAIKLILEEMCFDVFVLLRFDQIFVHMILKTLLSSVILSKY